MKRVAVLQGGPSEEHDVSRSTGRAVLDALDRINYPYRNVTITRKGEWLDSGLVRTPDAALEGIDVVFLALHGKFGEDGEIQRLLQRKCIPYTGSRAMASAIAFNKPLAKETLQPHGIITPRHRLLRGSSLWSVINELDNLLSELGEQLFLKPAASGSSYGAKVVFSRDELEQSLDELLPIYEEILVEEYVSGREATVGIIEDFRGQAQYVLPPVEITRPSGALLFSNEDKYSSSIEKICPGRFSYEEKKSMTDMALLAHTIIGCQQYSRSDFIVQNGKAYFLEINTLPGLTATSLLPQAAGSIGLGFDDLVRHLVDTARV